MKQEKTPAVKRQYECLYIIENTVSEDKRKELIEKFSKMAGSECKVEKWGMKKFVTPINYKKDGFYVLMNFTCGVDVPKKIGDLMNITEGIVRYIFVNKDDIKTVRLNSNRKSKKEVTTNEGGETA